MHIKLLWLIITSIPIVIIAVIIISLLRSRKGEVYLEVEEDNDGENNVKSIKSSLEIYDEGYDIVSLIRDVKDKQEDKEIDELVEEILRE